MESRWNKATFTSFWCAASGLLLIGICGVNLAQVARRVPAAPHFPPAIPRNIVLRHEARFAGLRAALNVRGIRGTVGYVSDVPAEQLPANDAAMQEYFMTQFALIPLVLEAKGEFPWAIANLHRAAPADRIPPAFRLVEDFGDGVLLLRKESP